MTQNFEPLPHQHPPEGKWKSWVISGGRGAGKTRAMLEYALSYMREHPTGHVVLLAPDSWLLGYQWGELHRLAASEMKRSGLHSSGCIVRKISGASDPHSVASIAPYLLCIDHATGFSGRRVEVVRRLVERSGQIVATTDEPCDLTGEILYKQLPSAVTATSGIGMRLDG